jgi:hypothetical protein
LSGILLLLLDRPVYPSPQLGGRMRVLIIGSFPPMPNARPQALDAAPQALDAERPALDPERERQYSDLCLNIGREIGNRRWSFAVSSDEKNTADLLVVEGAKKARARFVDIVVYWHDHDEHVPYNAAKDPRQGKIRFEAKHVQGTYVSGRGPQIDGTDVTLLIGGGVKTAPAYDAAFYRGKPCFPVPGFGGVSEELWDQRFVPANPKLKPEEERARFEGSDVESVRQLLDFLGKYVKDHRRSASVKKSYLVLLSVSTIIAFVAWAILFFGDLWTRNGYNLLGLLVASSFMGAALQGFVSWWRNRQNNDAEQSSEAELRLDLFWTRALAACIASLGFLLLYLVGSVAVYGPSNSLDNLSESGTFFRLGIVASFFGIAAGFLTEEIVEKYFVSQIQTFFKKRLRKGDSP